MPPDSRLASSAAGLSMTRRVRLERDVRARDHLDDPVGPEIEPGVRRVGVEGGAVAVLAGAGLEDRPLDVRRQQVEAGRGVVVEGDAVDVRRETLVVDPVDREDPPVGLDAADAGERMAPDLPGEDHVVRGDRRAVAPGGLGMQFVGDRDARLAVGRRLAHRQAVLDGRQLGAEQADQRPVLVVGGDRPPRHGQHVALGQHGVDVGVERRGELRDADLELAGAAGPRRGCHDAKRQPQGQKARQQESHVPPPLVRSMVGRSYPTLGRLRTFAVVARRRPPKNGHLNAAPVMA